MRKMTDRDRERVEQKKRPVVKATPKAPVEDNKIQEKLADVQIKAMLAMTEVAAQAINNPQIAEILALLSREDDDEVEVEEKPKRKHLKINRDMNGLIESIDIETT